MDIKALENEFYRLYGRNGGPPRFFHSPGRVNLIGEHTDYNGGYVLPAALTMGSTAIVRKRDDRTINLKATDLDSMVSASLDNLQRYRELGWGNYQLGVADELVKAGYNVSGCDMLYHDTVPLKSGLSSSAAIEVVTALALVCITGDNKNVDMVEMAKIAHKAENNYIGVNCGIMDQFASAMGRKGHAVFLNCRDLSYQHVPLKMEGIKIVISNTNKKRSLAVSEYNKRRAECERGLEMIRQKLPEATCLGDITVEEYKKYGNVIQDTVIRKRVEHVVYENSRVQKSANALPNGRLEEFGRLMNESHCSLRDLYEVTGPELDTLYDEALKIDGVLGSRMTGAGFGGCTVSLVRSGCIDVFMEEAGLRYENITGIRPDFYVTEAGEGGREITR